MVYARVLCCVLLPLAAFGQVNENFSDGDFDKAPEWQGSTNSFIINPSGQLQLDGDASGVAYLSTQSHATVDAHWEFEVELSFNPSARNLCRIYLISDLPDISRDLKGYYVQIGGIQDDISLYRQDVTKHTKIIDGLDGMVDTTKIKLVVAVTRDSFGLWELSSKHQLESQFQLIGQVSDQTHAGGHFFGFLCLFTSTRSQGFSLDNIHVKGKSVSDTKSPEVLSITVIDRHRLQILFNEPLQLPEPQQFIVLGIGPTSQIIRSGYNTWELTFSSGFAHGGDYVLEAKELSDTYGNPLSFSKQFQFWETGTATTHDLIISEIMADPSPPLQLPDKEYLEIYNRSDSAINILNWALSDATRTVKLPYYLISPGSFLVLCSKSKTIVGFDGISYLELPTWPSLNNSEDLIILADSTDSIIHFVNYQEDWYRSNLKQHGGWSIEIIDTNYPCSGAPNWTASSAASGGTPGKTNSVATDNPDLSPPVIVNTLAINSREIRITFDQLLSTEPDHSPVFGIDPPLTIDTFFIKSPIRPEITIRLADSLKPEIIYQISTSGLADCNGNINFGEETIAAVGLAQIPDSADVIINEILFNPRPLGVRFIELYNRSNKAFNLKNWRFARWQSNTLTDFTFLTKSDHMFYPGEYKAFTESPEKLASQYSGTSVSVLVGVDDLPTLGDNEGSISLVDRTGKVLDQLRYHKHMHHPLLTNLNGVSLERASPHVVTNDPNNWYSGAETAGYATPGSRNSQVLPESTVTSFKIEPRLFAPLSQQLPNYTRIMFQLDKPGNTGSVLIFNQRGYKVKTLVNNTLLSTSGSFQWDGTNDNRQPVPMGYYIVLFQVTLADGSNYNRRQTVAVAPNF